MYEMTGKFISKAAAEAAARSQARLLERAQAKLLNSGYNSNDYDDIDVNDGTTTNDIGTTARKTGSDDVSTTNTANSVNITMYSYYCVFCFCRTAKSK
jgi:hypothetical protein